MREGGEYSPHERTAEGTIKAKIEAVQDNFEYVQNLLNLGGDRPSERDIVLTSEAKNNAIASLNRLLELAGPDRRQAILNNITTHAGNYLRLPGIKPRQRAEMTAFLNENGINVKLPKEYDIQNFNPEEITTGEDDEI